MVFLINGMIDFLDLKGNQDANRVSNIVVCIWSGQSPDLNLYKLCIFGNVQLSKPYRVSFQTSVMMAVASHKALSLPTPRLNTCIPNPTIQFLSRILRFLPREL